VSESYAGRKGVARNVGVIGLAIFEEKAPPQIILPQRDVRWRGDGDDEGEEAGEFHARRGGADKAPAKPAEPRFRRPADVGGGAGGAPGGASPASEPAPEATASPSPPPAPPRLSPNDVRGQSRLEGRRVASEDAPAQCCNEKKVDERPGLGTEFGERRQSQVSWTKFERIHPTRPSAFAELRYNDADGLQALGIPIRPRPDAGEIETRETANPFPASGFATPPQGW
jgi:hypothetical protein